MALKSSMGSRRVVETSIVAWMDLLGYGSMLRGVGFDPTADDAKAAVERLNRFQDVVSKLSNKLMPSVVMNDGVALYRDLSPRDGRVTYEFINSVWELHREINRVEAEFGYPGIRTVVAAGFRVRRQSPYLGERKEGLGEHLIEQVESGKIPLKQAIFTALTARVPYDVTPELQANFAFSKAYMAESAGSKAGFSGSNMFVDLDFFTSPLPEWIEVGDSIGWQTDGMSATFAPVERIYSKRARQHQYQGALDAFDVAERLASDEGVSERLKSLTINKKLAETDA
ncbi:TPA: hypothetical protein ACPHTU_002597 [Vibrio alginolyticus]|nr:hypothetical protein [Vibrio harveyi]